MKAYNQNSQIMPLLMNFVVPTDIVEYVPTEFSYDDANQVTYEMTITSTRSLRHPSTHKGGEYVGVDAKNEIDDTKNNRHMWFQSREMILTYTNKEDTHPTNVIKYLNEWNVPVFRLNTECILTDYEFEWWCDDRGVDFRIKNIKNDLQLFGHEITAVWDRRALVPSELPVVNEHDEINRHNLDEARGFLAFLRYYTKDIFSIGSIVEDRPADSKMLQLQVARSLGMPTPDTSFANTKEAVLKFARNYEYISLKSIVDSGLFLGGDKEYVFFSQRIKSRDLESQPDEAFSQTVSFVQNYIDKKYELRITVVCDDVIACKIDSQLQSETTGKIDWRQGYEHDLKHEIVEIPDFVSDFCRKFLKRMKLNFGCFDFIVTPDDKYVFLECNPNGQWLWIEIVTEYDISKVIAKNLAKKER